MRSDLEGLSASKVSFAYGPRLVVDNVSLELPRGQMVALAGPNGSGKTTLLKILSGVRAPAGGSVTLDGVPLAQLGRRKVAQRVAVVSQHLDPKLMFSVESLVSMGRTPYQGLLGSTTQSDKAAIDDALQAAELTLLRHRRFGELSGGEQQRVMLAMALAQQADYLLLDEPTVHLDLHHQHELLELLRALHEHRRLGILAVMHDLNLAALYFEGMGLMQEGRLVADGPSADLLRRGDCLSIFQAPLKMVNHPEMGVPQVLLGRKA
jgi:iron complex transport system ATP-binding protein